MESDLDETVCENLSVALTGSEPYVNLYSPDLGIPVYMAFPAADVEAFLESFFGENPTTYYRD